MMLLGMTPLEWIGVTIAGLTLAAAIMVVTSRVPIHAACFLILTLLGVAAEYAILEAHTLAILQILVYAGAIVVLIVFVLMLMGSGPNDEEPVKLGSLRVAVGGVMALALLVLFGLAWRAEGIRPAAEHGPAYGELEPLGQLLLGPYVFSFEIISLLLMVAIVGAVALLKRRTATDDEEGAKE